jgi:hypothetical protein
LKAVDEDEEVGGLDDVCVVGGGFVCVRLEDKDAGVIVNGRC